MWWLYRMTKLGRRLWQARREPRQLALACALGFLLGVLPKGNLTVGLVGLFVFAVRSNLPAVLLVATAVSFVAPALDPVTGAIGERLLTHPRLVPLWWSLHELPFVPWLRWNNTVVLGSFVFGLVSSPAIYQASRFVLLRVHGSRTADSPGPIEHRDAVDRELIHADIESGETTRFDDRHDMDETSDADRDGQAEPVVDDPTESGAPILLRLPEIARPGPREWGVDRERSDGEGSDSDARADRREAA